MKHVEQPEAEWIGQNRKWLEEHHAGKWIAVHGSELVAVADTLKEAAAQAAANGFPDPIFDAVRAKRFQGVLMIRPWR